MSRSGNKQNGLVQPKQEVSIKYLHQPPTIQPNYGTQKRSLLPKSKVSRVLLYDNATQDHMLGIKLAHINIEQERTNRLITIQSKSFFNRQKKIHKHMKKFLTNTDTISNGSKVANAATSLPNIHRSQSDIREEREMPLLRERSRISDSVLDFSETELRLPGIEQEKRRVVFKLKDASGNTQVYHTVDKKGEMFAEIIPLHSFYTRMTDDPRFQGLANILVPKEQENVI